MATVTTLKVTAWSLNVREDASVNSKAKDWIHKDETYTSSKSKNGWYYIDSLKGWVSGNYVTVTGTNTIAANTSQGNTSNNQNAKSNTTKINNTSSAVKSKETKNYVVNVSKSAGDRLDTFSSVMKNSTGVDIVDNVNIQLRSRTGNVTKALGVDRSGEYYTVTNGFATFGDSRNSRRYSTSLDDFDGMVDALNVARKQMNIFSESDTKKLFSRFNRFKSAMPGAELHRAYPYIFFTRPEIDLTELDGSLNQKIAGVHNVFSYLYNSNPDILRSLGRSFSNDHRFNVFLTNMARSFDPADEVIRTVETGETYTGWKMVYARNTNESNTAGQFNIQYRDNNNLDITKMHKAWIEYMNLAYRGAITIPRDIIHKKILNYVCAVYFIVCAEDGETILFWSKYFGVFPINAPYSNNGWVAGSPNKSQEFTISYMYAMKEDYDPITLAEFNLLSSGATEYSRIYNQHTLTSAVSLSGAPYIDQLKGPDGKIIYKLRFRV